MQGIQAQLPQSDFTAPLCGLRRSLFEGEALSGKAYTSRLERDPACAGYRHFRGKGTHGHTWVNSLTSHLISCFYWAKRNYVQGHKKVSVETRTVSISKVSRDPMHGGGGGVVPLGNAVTRDGDGAGVSTYLRLALRPRPGTSLAVHGDLSRETRLGVGHRGGSLEAACASRCMSKCCLRHFMRRFWNQTLTWASVSRRAAAR